MGDCVFVFPTPSQNTSSPAWLFLLPALLVCSADEMLRSLAVSRGAFPTTLTMIQKKAAPNEPVENYTSTIGKFLNEISNLAPHHGIGVVMALKRRSTANLHPDTSSRQR